MNVIQTQIVGGPLDLDMYVFQNSFLFSSRKQFSVFKYSGMYVLKVHNISHSLPMLTHTHWSHTRNSLAMTLKIVLRDGLREDIGDLVLCPNGINFDEAIADVLAEVMKARVDVFGARTEFGKTGKFEGTGVVLECFAIDVGHVGDDLESFFTYFLNEKHDGKDVAERLRKRYVFGLCRG